MLLLLLLWGWAARSLNSVQITALLDALTSCHEFARDFNADVELRNQLWSQGFMKKVPHTALVLSFPFPLHVQSTPLPRRVSSHIV